MPCLNQSDSPSHVRLSNSSPSSLKPPSFAPLPSQRSGEKLLNGRGSTEAPAPRSTTSPSSLNGRPSPARSPLDRKPPSTPSPSPQDRKGSQSPSPSHRTGALQVLAAPLEKRHQNGTKSSSRSQKRLSGQCGDRPLPHHDVASALSGSLVVDVARPDPASPPLLLLLTSSRRLRAVDLYPLIHKLPLPEKAVSF